MKNIWSASAKSSVFNTPMFGDSSVVGRKKISTDTDELASYGGYAAVVSACVDAITRDVVSQKLTFKNSKTGEIIENSRIPANILAPYMGNWRGLWLRDVLNVVIPSKLLTGNAFIWNTTGTAYGQSLRIKDSFIPVASHNVKINLNVNGEGVDYYDVKLGGMVYQVPPDEMIHIRQTPIYNPFVGVGNVAKARLLIEGEYAATEYINAFLNEAQGAPTMIMVDKTNYMHEEKVRMADMLKQKWSSKIMYLNVGSDGADIVQNSLLTRDFDFLEKRKFDMDAILAVFGVPKLVLGMPEGSNKSTSTNQIPLYYKSTVNPCIKEISYFLTNHHVRKYSNDIEVCFETHASGDIADVERMLLSGIITPNRAAEMMGQDVDLGSPGRDTFYIPNSVSFGASDVQDTPPEPYMETVEDEEKMSRKDLKDPRNVDAIVETFNKATGFDRLYQARFVRKSLLSRNAIEEKYSLVISQYFKGLEAGVLDLFKKKFDVKLDGANPDLIRDLENEVIIFLNLQIQAEKEMLTPLYTSGVQRAIADVNAITGTGIVASFSNPFVRGAVENLGNKITGVITETTKKDLRKLFAKALDEGWNINAIQDEIQRKFEQYQTTRARMIARTEARAAWDAGAEVAYKDIGVEKVDVIGCTMFEWDSDCGRRGIPVGLISSLKFHPNHIGSLAPSEE